MPTIRQNLCKTTILVGSTLIVGFASGCSENAESQTMDVPRSRCAASGPIDSPAAPFVDTQMNRRQIEDLRRLIEKCRRSAAKCDQDAAAAYGYTSAASLRNQANRFRRQAQEYQAEIRRLMRGRAAPTQSQNSTDDWCRKFGNIDYDGNRKWVGYQY